MIPDIERTIVALGSGARPGRRAIVRLTGPATQQVLSRLLALPCEEGILASTGLSMCEASCTLPEIGRSLPVRLLYWPDLRSYTGQPSAELHLIGCVPLAEAIIARCCQLGAEPAERGEFTLRAFLAGKLDLAQAEAVLGVIEADSPAALQTALAQLGGNLAPAIQPLRATLVNIVAELEAALDFVDEDIEFIARHSVITQLEEVQAALADFGQRLVTRSTTDIVPRAALVGLPNSGKSSLFNALCEEQVAIVADVPGTTRDYLERRIDAEGVEVDLIDTAGWEELRGDSPRAQAQQKLLDCLASADVCLLCIDSGQPCAPAEIDRILASIQRSPSQWLLVATKRDLKGSSAESLIAIEEQVARHFPLAAPPISTSARTAEGLDALRAAIAIATRQVSSAASPLAVVHHTAVRCRAALAAAMRGVQEALATARDQWAGEELIAAELRLVLDDLATIIGEVHSDDVLGEIFSRFCIGK
jgi:tRNA modification GTPase